MVYKLLTPVGALEIVVGGDTISYYDDYAKKFIEVYMTKDRYLATHNGATGELYMSLENFMKIEWYTPNNEE